jgi:hypothetical protein
MLLLSPPVHWDLAPNTLLASPNLRLPRQVNPLSCRGFTVWGRVGGVYSRVVGIGVLRRLKA